MHHLEGAAQVGLFKGVGDDQGDGPDEDGDQRCFPGSLPPAQANGEGRGQQDKENGLQEVSGHGPLAQSDKCLEWHRQRVASAACVGGVDTSLQGEGGQSDGCDNAWACPYASNLVKALEMQHGVFWQDADFRESKRNSHTERNNDCDNSEAGE